MLRNNITIHDIARKLDISASTVSRALNDNPRISLSTRQTVKEIAEKFGYQPNIMASYLRKGKNKTVGVIVPRVNRFFFSNVIGGIEDVLTPAGYSLTICQSHESYAKEFLNFTTMNHLRMDGIIVSLATGTVDTSHLQLMISKGLKLVMFDRVSEELDVSSVKLDDFSGAYKAVSHLIDQGYKKIAHFSGPGHVNVYNDRKAGYLKALEDRGIETRDTLIIEDCLTKEKGMEATRDMLDRKDKPDAIFSASDFSAIGAMITARSKGYNVPSEIGIAGFANEPFTEFVSPSLTSVDQDSMNMGRLTAQVFLNLTDHPDDHSMKEKIVVAPRLVVRESSMRNLN